MANGVRLAMRGRVAFLHSAVVAASKQFSTAFEYRGTDGDSAFRKTEARLFHCSFQHDEIHFSIFFCVSAHFSPASDFPASLRHLAALAAANIQLKRR